MNYLIRHWGALGYILVHGARRDSHAVYLFYPGLGKSIRWIEIELIIIQSMSEENGEKTKKDQRSLDPRLVDSLFILRWARISI